MLPNPLKSIALILATLLAPSQGWALTLDDVVKNVESNYKNIVAFKGSFNQTATLKTLNKVQKGQGKIFYKKPNKIKWQYMKPAEQEIISDGKTLWMYLPENRQVYIYELADDKGAANQGQIPGNFLTSLGDMRRDFSVRWGTPKDRDAQGNYIIELVPKEPVANLRNIFLIVRQDITAVSSSTFPVLASTVYDSYGNMTNIEFINIEVLETADETVAAKKKGGTLPDSIFTYLPPADVEIVKPPLMMPK